MSMRYYLIICILACLCLNKGVLAEDGAEVLEKLKRYDSIYEAGFTISGTQASQDIVFQQGVKHKWRLTFEGDRCGYLMEMLEYEKPKFQMPDNNREISLNADGWRLQSVRTKKWGYWGDDVSGNYYEDTVLKISPGGEVAEVGKMHNTSLFGPRDVGPNIPKRVILWSLGRFYSKLINEITEVKELPNGRIIASALGKKGDGQPGRWELEIDPAAAWLVREARYYSEDNPDVIKCEMKNSGTKWSGSYCIPQKALFNYMGPIEGNKKHYLNELTFDPKVEKFDEKLYNGSQQAVTKNRPPKLTIHDYRMSPPMIFQPDNLRDVVLDIALDSLTPSGELPNKVVAKPENKTTSMPSLNSETSPAIDHPAQNSRRLLPVKWAVVVLILAVAIAVCACVILFKSKSQKS